MLPCSKDMQRYPPLPWRRWWSSSTLWNSASWPWSQWHTGICKLWTRVVANELLLIWAKKFELIVIGFKSCPAASSRKTQKKSLLLTTHINPRLAVIGGICWILPRCSLKPKNSCWVPPSWKWQPVESGQGNWCCQHVQHSFTAVFCPCSLQNTIMKGLRL